MNLNRNFLVLAAASYTSSEEVLVIEYRICISFPRMILILAIEHFPKEIAFNNFCFPVVVIQTVNSSVTQISFHRQNKFIKNKDIMIRTCFISAIFCTSTRNNRKPVSSRLIPDIAKVCTVYTVQTLAM